MKPYYDDRTRKPRGQHGSPLQYDLPATAAITPSGAIVFKRERRQRSVAQRVLKGRLLVSVLRDISPVSLTERKRREMEPRGTKLPRNGTLLQSAEETVEAAGSPRPALFGCVQPGVSGNCGAVCVCVCVWHGSVSDRPFARFTSVHGTAHL